MSLTDISYYIRKFLPFVILFCLVFLILTYAIKLTFIYLQMKNPQSVYTNPVFGKIKKPVTKDALYDANLNFIIDTIEGRPITATETAKVFYIPPPTTRFGYREKIYLVAKTFGFDTEIVKHQMTGKEAIFADDKQKLAVDITNFNFTYEYDFKNDVSLFEKTLPPGKKESETKAIDFLKSVGRYPEELAKGKTNIIYLFFNQTTQTMTVLDKTANISANIVEVDFYRPDVDDYPIISPSYFNSQHYVLMVFNENGFKILRAQVKFFDKSDEQVGVYPVKTGEMAFTSLKSGKALIITKPTDQKDIVIKKMFLGYLDSDIYEDYFQPIYVFLGQGNFVAYVPAVIDDYLVE